MELMLQWFWLVKLLAILVFLGSIYYAYKAKFKSKTRNAIVVILAIIAIVSPVKLEQTNTYKHSTVMNNMIEQSKQLPTKVIDNSFNTKTAEDMRITPDDLK